MFVFFPHNLAGLLKISNKYGCADTGAISEWSAHENHDTAYCTADYIAGVKTTLSSSSLARQLGGVAAQRHHQLWNIALSKNQKISDKRVKHKMFPLRPLSKQKVLQKSEANTFFLQEKQLHSLLFIGRLFAQLLLIRRLKETFRLVIRVLDLKDSTLHSFFSQSLFSS